MTIVVTFILGGHGSDLIPQSPSSSFPVTQTFPMPKASSNGGTEKEGVGGYAPFAPARGHWGNDRGMGVVFYSFLSLLL